MTLAREANAAPGPHPRGAEEGQAEGRPLPDLDALEATFSSLLDEERRLTGEVRALSRQLAAVRAATAPPRGLTDVDWFLVGLGAAFPIGLAFYLLLIAR
jgi:hypothetical protein